MPDVIAGVTKPNLFQDWYDMAVKPRIEGKTTFPDARKALAAAGQPLPPAPGAEPLVRPPMLDASTTFPAPMNSPPAAMPGYEVAPPETPEPTLGDKFNAGLDKISTGLQDPARMGLLTAGLSMMALPPRQTPYSNTEVLGHGGLAGVAMYEKALEAKRRQQALDEGLDERRLAREDRASHNRAVEDTMAANADTRRMNALTLTDQREATTWLRKTQEASEKTLNEPVPDSVFEAYGMPNLKGQGITGRQFKEYGLGAMNRPRIVTSDDGTVSILQGDKPPIQFHGMGKKTQPKAGTKGGKPSSLAEKMTLAEKSWREDEANKGKEPTVADIAKRAQELWPPTAVQTAAAKKKTSSLRPGAAGETTKVINGKTYVKQNGKWYEK